MVDTDKKQLPLLHCVLTEEHLDVILQGKTLLDDTTYDKSTAEGQKLSTLWEKNNVILSFPIKMAFATNEAVCECLEMCKRISDKQVSEFDAVDNNDDLDRPISEQCVGLAGDEGPMVQAIIMKQADDACRWENINLFVGVFHWLMEIFKLNNKMHEEIF
mgnify:CR=1 FL=1